MLFRIPTLILPLLLVMGLMGGMGTVAHARPDIVSQYVEAVMTADTATLQKILAENFVHIGGNGFLQDKENFIENLKDGNMDVRRLTVSDVVASHYGGATLVTGNSTVHGTFVPPQPQGSMRFTMVLQKVNDQEKVILVQRTPVKETKARKPKGAAKKGDGMKEAPKVTPAP